MTVGNFMIQNLSTDFFWYLITIDDCRRMLNGESIYEMLKLIQDIEQIKFVVLDDIEGAGKYGLIASLQDNIDKIYEIKSILEKSKEIIQLDWGDFFLFKEYPNSWINLREGDYPYVIAQADTTLRAIDDQYMYIYTQSKHLVESIKSQYEIESIKFDLLENLDFPY